MMESTNTALHQGKGSTTTAIQEESTALASLPRLGGGHGLHRLAPWRRSLLLDGVRARQE